MNNLYSFEFSDVLISSPNDYIAKVPAGISSTEDLFQTLYNVLELPGYFGFNWNALSDCLRDFHWINSYKIIIQHEDLPALKPQDLYLYLEILHEAKTDWKHSKEHLLTITFPTKFKNRVLNISEQTP